MLAICAARLSTVLLPSSKTLSSSLRASTLATGVGGIHEKFLRFTYVLLGQDAHLDPSKKGVVAGHSIMFLVFFISAICALMLAIV